MSWLPTILAELPITLADPAVWMSIGEGLLFGGVALVLGVWTARMIGLLQRDAPAGETIGVGLATGLLMLAACWAALWSGGRSSFTPVAVGFAVAVGLAVARRAGRFGSRGSSVSGPASSSSEPAGRAPRRPLVVAILASAAFVVAVAVLYGATVAPSPHNGVQPVEQLDQVFYAVLGRDLATTGIEATTGPSGFPAPAGAPPQQWYHWGELWLAAGIITILRATPMHARYFVVLPVLLLAAAGLTGTLVRRANGTRSRRAFLFGFVACLFLSPVPFLPGPFYSTWASGLVFEINLFGLAAVAALLTLYLATVLSRRQPTWELATFVGTTVAVVLPAHIVVALLGLAGVGSAWAVRVGPSLVRNHRLPRMAPAWRRTVITAALGLITTVVWGGLTGHGLGSGGPLPNVTPFNPTWGATVAIVVLGSGVFFAIPLAWLIARRSAPPLADIYLGTAALAVAGTIVWGLRVAEFDTFYFFFGAIAVFVEPVAAVAVWQLGQHLRVARHPRLVATLVALTIIQLDLAAVFSGLRLGVAGPGGETSIPVSVLDAIERLPAGAELAYACQPFEEVSYGNPKLISIDVHTGHRVVPMCFAADIYSTLVGARPSPDVPNAYMAQAPQHFLYPTASAHPSPATVAAFLKEHGIDYIYADARHPNTLVPAALPITKSGSFDLLRVP